MLTGVIVFALTYILISARRLGWLPLDRPGAALLGAALTVGAGVLPPARAVAAVDCPTLILLFGMMGMGAFLAASGFFNRAAGALPRWVRTPGGLLGALVWSSAALSALITNDAVCVLAAPLVLEVIHRHKLPPLPYLLALATAANTGSAATLVGNPQNMLCQSLGGLRYMDHLLLMAPVAIMATAINHLMLWMIFRKRLPSRLEAPSSGRMLEKDSGCSLVVIGVTTAAYAWGGNLAWTAAGGCAALFVLLRPEPESIWRRVDWSVLLFFACLFVVVEGFVQTGVPALFFSHIPLWRGEGLWAWMRLALYFLVGSNVVSNVPFILVVKDQMASLPDPRLGWEMLAMASTFAGNLTLLGSVANIIVAEKGREAGGMGFWQHLRIGFPLAAATTFLGALWLVWRQ